MIQKNTGSEKKYIIFTDLKEFTYKNTLLTDSQISTILEKFHEIVKTWADTYGVKIIKSIWDAYFAISDNAEPAYRFSNEILSLSQKYDEKQNIALKKISLRITITYWNITQNTALDLEDYFGEAINLWARIMDMTPEGKIFCTEQVKENLSSKKKAQYIWDFSFHGILQELPLYSLTPISEEMIKLLKDSHDSHLQECEDIVFRSSCVAAILSVQPLPFLENFNLVAVHLYMIVRISAKFDKNLSLKDSSKVFQELIAPLWLSYAAFQWSASMIKILLPWIWGYLFAPVSFSVSYALWKLYIMYFYYQASGEVLTPELIKELFKKHRIEGKNLAKSRKSDILWIWKLYSKEVIHIWNHKEFTKVQKDTIEMLKSKK